MLCRAYGCSFIDLYFEYIICKFTITIKSSLICTLEDIILLTLYQLIFPPRRLKPEKCLPVRVKTVKDKVIIYGGIFNWGFHRNKSLSSFWRDKCELLLIRCIY